MAVIAGNLVGMAAVAMAGAAPADSPGTALPEVGSSIVRLLGAFSLVVALLLGGVWLVRNWHRFSKRPMSPRKLQVLEVKPLGNRQSLLVVGFEQERLLLASSPSGITLISHLLPLRGGLREPEPGPASFAESLQTLLGHTN